MGSRKCSALLVTGAAAFALGAHSAAADSVDGPAPLPSWKYGPVSVGATPLVAEPALLPTPRVDAPARFALAKKAKVRAKKQKVARAKKRVVRRSQARQ
jgi:hypothetical protein